MALPHSLPRRSVLSLAALGTGVGIAGSLGLPNTAHADSEDRRPGYGPLVPDPKGLIDLPLHFTYSVVAISSGVLANGAPLAPTTLTDGGENSPSRYDGTGSFSRRGGGAVLVSNHENGTTAVFPVPHRDRLTYDAGAAWGGTTTLSVDRNGRRVSEVVSLAGTIGNCAGGVTPWATWLTCEETETKAGQKGALKDHGYVFEVDPYDPSRNLDPQPIKAFGRFPHEAIVVDPSSGQTYSTEDAGSPNGLLYRWTPDRHARLRTFRGLAPTAGSLEAMYVTREGTFVPDLSVVTEVGTTLDVTWKKVPDRDATTTSTRKQFDYLTKDSAGLYTVPVAGPAGPITRSRKLEGAWWGRGGFFFDCSFARPSDGSASTHDGQIWFFDVSRQTIRLVSYMPATPDQDVDVDGPDNLTVNPHGGLVVCEDGDGVNHLVLVAADGSRTFFARNRNDSEFAGANFSPDGRTLFANSQDPGVVFAITGPWRRS